MTTSPTHRSQWDACGELWTVTDEAGRRAGASFARYGPDGTLTSMTGFFDGANP